MDLSFVREFVGEKYAQAGRPSIDPIVFFKLQLVMFFEGIRSERELIRQGSDRLSVRWYLGYDLGEPFPDHSSLTRVRTRYGLDVFHRFFDESTTDPDATPMRLKNGGLHLGYHTHYVVDGGKQRIILSALVTPSEVIDNQPMLDLVQRDKIH